ncbi:GNAT family N-acetyltransferase [Martelella alba]|uniref:GNAT family N-acetyltransferase n=1 Tax=Martelella alba TaxID=2590451 RepID=A0A506UD10_9HYPH|nr:GNAT family N-acetyltransferase [Martelella alba]TPW31488.1 GNAT family N-acetyltransferase [Martelella alba]
MMKILDRPVWNALTTRHAHLAEGDGQALRYPASIIPFAAMRDADARSGQSLAEMLRPGDTVMLVEHAPIIVPEKLEILKRARITQMVGAVAFEPVPDERVSRLGPGDAEDMLELALLTRPGPFSLHAQTLGPFWGVRVDGRLAAMAGQRMHVDGFVELSGLCTHPDYRGQGLGGLLLRFVAGAIAAGGGEVFLHTYADNMAAIRLYEGLGFRRRIDLDSCLVERR